MKAEKGSRKMAVVHETALLLLGGLIVCLAVACILFRDAGGRIDAAGVDLLYKLYAIFAAGLTGKATAFMWGNAQEYKAQPPVQPASK